MRLKQLPLKEIKKRLAKQGLILAIGPFNIAIKSNLSTIAENLQRVYSEFSVLTDDALIDFYVRVDKPRSIRRWIKPQVFFYFDDVSPFLPLPASQAYPLLEWGMNWCIAKFSHQYLILHAAVLEKNDSTIILPAESGSGKSTLTALLTLNGWRLLSDEMALIDNLNGKLIPIARPISLKNESITLIKNVNNDAVFSDIVDDTNKGTISHLKPSNDSVEKLENLGSAKAIIFPKFNKQSATIVAKVDKANAFMKIIENSFNYNVLADVGFKTLSRLIQNVDCYEFQYSDTQEAVAFFESIISPEQIKDDYS